jgi:hypothetical protein
MDPGKLIGAEILVAVGITSWGAIKQGQAPWPPTIIGSMVAYCILLLLSAVSAPLAAILATGFLLALLIGQLDGAQGGSIADKFGALPPQGVGFDVLHFRQNSRPAVPDDGFAHPARNPRVRTQVGDPSLSAIPGVNQ